MMEKQPVTTRDLPKIGSLVAHHYQIKDSLGEGGMGFAFRATDTRLGREVALKFIHPEILAEEHAAKRFTQEGKILATMKNPYVVQVFSSEIDPDSGLPFLVMELINGKTMDSWLTRSQNCPIDIFQRLWELAEGIRRCHKAGIIHRDLKPGNIVIEESGSLKVIDFGIAKVTVNLTDQSKSEKHLEASKKNEKKLTQTGQMLGTPLYMAPEQCVGNPNLSEKADVYSFGCIAWEAALGAPPFTTTEEVCDPALAVALMHLQTPPPFERLLSTKIGNELHPLLIKMLNKDPNLRPSMSEVALELEKLIQRNREQEAMGGYFLGGTNSPKPVIFWKWQSYLGSISLVGFAFLTIFSLWHHFIFPVPKMKIKDIDLNGTQFSNDLASISTRETGEAAMIVATSVRQITTGDFGSSATKPSNLNFQREIPFYPNPIPFPATTPFVIATETTSSTIFLMKNRFGSDSLAMLPKMADLIKRCFEPSPISEKPLMTSDEVTKDQFFHRVRGSSGDLSIYLSPTKTSEAIGKIPPKASRILFLGECQNKFFKISYEGNVGWAEQHFLYPSFYKIKNNKFEKYPLRPAPIEAQSPLFLFDASDTIVEYDLAEKGVQVGGQWWYPVIVNKTKGWIPIHDLQSTIKHPELPDLSK